MPTPQPAPVSHGDLALLVEGRYGDPHALLGVHPHDGGVTIRTLKPLAETVTVVYGDERHPLSHEAHGVWSGAIPTSTPPTTGSR